MNSYLTRRFANSPNADVVHRAVAKMCKQFKGRVDPEALESVAWEAYCRFYAKRAVGRVRHSEDKIKARLYRSVHRAMQDELRRIDRLGRGTRQLANRAKEALGGLSAGEEFDRFFHGDVAEQLGVTTKAVAQATEADLAARHVSLEFLGRNDGARDGVSEICTLADKQAANVVPETVHSLDGLELQDAAQLYVEALERLPGTQRKAIRLKFFSGLSLSEVAGQLHITKCAADRLVNSGLSKLRKLQVTAEIAS